VVHCGLGQQASDTRLKCIAHLLSLMPYDKAPCEKVKIPARRSKDQYDDEKSLEGQRFVPETY